MLEPCIFSDSQLGRLFEICPKTLNSLGKCSPVIDLGPGYKAIRCFGCEDILSVDVRDFNSLAELNSYFIREIDDYKKHLVSSKCSNCNFYLNENCFGGCFANYSKKLVDIENNRKLNSPFVFTSDKEIICRALYLFQKSCKKDFVNYIRGNLIAIQSMKKYQSFYVLAEYYNVIGNKIQAISSLRSCLRICPQIKKAKLKTFLYNMKKS